MKTTTLLLSGMIALSSVVAVAGQTHAAVATDGQSGTSKVTATLTSSTDPADKTVKLTAVPDLDFGTKEITAAAIDMPQTTDGTVSVSDARGTGAGYTVDVALTTPFTDTASHVLTGSTLSVINAGGKSVENASNTNAGTTATLTDTAAQNIVTAKTGEGLGNWNYTIKGSNLNVLPGAYAGSYEGQLTWTLTATPKA